MPTTKQLEDAERLLTGFDWSAIDALSDEQIIAAAKSDPDSAVPSDEELAEFVLVAPTQSRKASPEAAE